MAKALTNRNVRLPIVVGCIVLAAFTGYWLIAPTIYAWRFASAIQNRMFKQADGMFWHQQGQECSISNIAKRDQLMRMSIVVQPIGWRDVICGRRVLCAHIPNGVTMGDGAIDVFFLAKPRGIQQYLELY